MRLHKKIISLCLCTLLTLSLVGCKEKKADIPELLDPIESKDVIYTVTKGDLSAVSYRQGRVIPEKVAMVTEYDTTYYDGNVKVGDTVKKGQVLFRLNSDLNEQILNLKVELEVQEKSFTLLKKQQDEQIKAMRDQIKMLRSFGDYYNAKLVEIQMRQQEFQFDFDNKGTEERIAEMKEQLAKYNEDSNNSTVTAPCDGTVVFSVIGKEGDLAKEETYLIIVKDDTKMISCDYMKQEVLDAYEKIQAQIGDKVYDLTSVPFAEEDIRRMEGENFYQDTTFTGEDLPDTLALGDYIGLLFTNIEPDVLSVPTQSLQVMQGTYYVTVVNGESRELREVSVGRSNLNHTIITEGLKENEKIFVAKNLESFSAKSETVKPEIGAFVSEMRVTGVTRTSENMGPFVNEVPGTLKEVLIPLFGEQYVEAGTPLYTIEAKIADLDLEQARIDYKNFQKDYEAQIERYEKQIKDDKKALKDIKDKTEKELAQIAIDRLEREFAKYKEEGSEQLADYKKRISNFEKWQDTEVTVCAEETCIIETFSSLKVGSEMTEGQYICETMDPGTFLLHIKDEEATTLLSYLRYGQTVLFSSRLAGELVEVDARVMFAKSCATAETWKGEASLVLEDTETYLKSNNTGTLFFDRCNVSNVLTIPREALRIDRAEEAAKPGIGKDEEEDEVLSGSTSYYVWVYNQDGVAVRRNVRVAEAYDKTAWICDGLSVDDVIVLP